MSKPKAKRHLLHCAQGETLRFYNNGRMFDCDLGTLGIDSCVVVVLRDKKGNISLSHIDKTADLSFIAREAAIMQGEYTIDVCAIDGNSKFAPVVLQYVKDHFPDIKNSKGTQEPRKMKLQEGGKPANLLVKRDDHGIKQPSGEQLDAAYNFLSDGTFNDRQRCQAVRQFFTRLPATLPQVMNDEKGAPMPRTGILDHPEIVRFLEETRPLMVKGSEQDLRKKCEELAIRHSGETKKPFSMSITLNYLDLLPQVLKEYFEMEKSFPQSRVRVTDTSKTAQNPPISTTIDV